MVSTLMYYFIQYGPGFTCKHKHRSEKAARACLHHYRIYYKDAEIMKMMKVIELVSHKAHISEALA